MTVESTAGPDGALHPGAAGDGRAPRLAMRLLHAGLRHVALRAVDADRRPAVLDDRNDALAGQSLPLHRLPSRSSRPRSPPPWRADRRRTRSTPNAPTVRARLRDDRRTAASTSGAASSASIAPRDRRRARRGSRSSIPTPLIVAGGTDVGLWVTKQHCAAISPGVFIGHRELTEIAVSDARASRSAPASPMPTRCAVARRDTARGRGLRCSASARWQIRNLGTIGGNIANGSPIGDTPPPLIALGARIVLRRGDVSARAAARGFLHRLPQDSARRRASSSRPIVMPLPRPARAFAAYKVSKRFDAGHLRRVAAPSASASSDGRIAEARIGFGGMAATPKRASEPRAALVGRPLTEASFDSSGASALDDGFLAAHRHARQRRLSPPGGAQSVPCASGWRSGAAEPVRMQRAVRSLR